MPASDQLVAAPARRERHGGSQWASTRAAIVAVVWSVFLVWLLVLIFRHQHLMRVQMSAIQEAAAAADSCFWVVVAYSACRAIDAMMPAAKS